MDSSGSNLTARDDCSPALGAPAAANGIVDYDQRSQLATSRLHPPPSTLHPPRTRYATRMNARTIAAVCAGKVAAASSRLLGRGGGTAIAGLVAQRIDPAIIRHLASQAGAGAIAITGTNGKTTTSLMLKIGRASCRERVLASV